MEQEPAKLAFVTAAYGEDFFPFLLSHLFSMHAAHPHCKSLVLWQDMPEQSMKLLEAAFPSCMFIKTNESLGASSVERIALKLKAWYIGAEICADMKVCFADCDTLFVKSIEPFFNECFDFTITWKDQVWPINTGVFLGTGGSKLSHFMKEWLSRTCEILSDANRANKANFLSGAPDQHSLRELIGFVNYDGFFNRSILETSYVIRGVNYQYLNQFDCAPITEETYIIHYKTGWHPILFKHQGFTTGRPKEKCLQMYEYFIKVFQMARTHLMSKTGADIPNGFI